MNAPTLKLQRIGNGGRGNAAVQTAIPPPIPTIYVLRSRKDGTPLAVEGLRYGHLKMDMQAPLAPKSYRLGFIHPEDAAIVRRETCSKSKIEFASEIVGGVDPRADDDGFAIVTMQRYININELPMFLHEVSFLMFLELPLVESTSIGVVHQVLEVTEREIVMEVQTMDALDIFTM